MNILLACDPLLSHEDLVQHVTARVWPENAEFRVLAVTERMAAGPIPNCDPQAADRQPHKAREKAEEVSEYLRSGGLNASPVAMEGDPREIIVSEAELRGIDLILLGAPRREDALPFLTTRVARAVLRHARCSVQLVRTGRIHRVLLPTDGSECSLAAARSVAARQWDDGTVFEVMSVLEPLPASVRLLHPLPVNGNDAEQIRADEMTHAQNAIKASEEILAEAGLTVSDYVLIPVNMPNKLIVEDAANWGADLIAIGSHGKRRMRHALIGSVSESVAMHAGCSVEVVR